MFHFLRNIEDQPVGGKAKGLKVLKELGLKVPDSFVIIHPNGHELPEDLLRSHLKDLGEGPKAVRSSAVSEDGAHASFAGQFESYLNVSGTEEIRKAIRKCVDSVFADRISQYSQNIHHKADTRISIIIQNMVDARKAGVIFSADPVSNRRDRMMINVSSGTGEDLVGGKKDAVQYLVYRSGNNIPSQIRRNGDMLSAEQLRELIEGAKKAEKAYRSPVDLEWAIDSGGVIHWLQVRPITTLDPVHFNELDDVREERKDVWSLGNIGEMMPGVVTPLTYSVAGRIIDASLGYLAALCGVIPMKRIREWQSLEVFYNRIFFNLTTYMVYARKLALNRREHIIIQLSAQDVPELVVGKLDPGIPRFIRMSMQMTSLMFAGRRIRKIHPLGEGFRIPMTGDLTRDQKALDLAYDKLIEAFCIHLLSSSQSGLFYSVMTGILTQNKRQPEAKDHYLLSLLLADIPGIESADAVKSLDCFADEIRNSPDFARSFAEASPAGALLLLKNEAPEELRNGYDRFLQRHGHRCIRELEFREKPWEEDQEHLVAMIQASVRVGRPARNHAECRQELKSLMSETLNPMQRFFIRRFENLLRKAVVRRELTKSVSIRMINETRKAYRHLAQTLVSQGLLDDTDQVFFLTREELRQLITGRSKEWKATASKRRVILPETAKLKFPLMNVGNPEPLEEDEEVTITGNQMKGIPVSVGVVTARARVVKTLDEASALEKGEIMVVSFTDIGWTPYFSLISGLVTEIGSPLSHGGVVAREYGIPAVVSVKGATQCIKTGDTITLDGSRGFVEVH